MYKYYTIQKKTVFHTSDGKYFDSLKEAKKHHEALIHDAIKEMICDIRKDLPNVELCFGDSVAIAEWIIKHRERLSSLLNLDLDV